MKHLDRKNFIIDRGDFTTGNETFAIKIPISAIRTSGGQIANFVAFRSKDGQVVFSNRRLISPLASPQLIATRFLKNQIKHENEKCKVKMQNKCRKNNSRLLQ